MSENSGHLAQAENDSNIRPTKKRSVKKIILYVLVACVAVLVALTFFVNSATKAPVAASNQFLNAMQAGDAATAYSYFSSDAKNAVPEDQFATVVKQIAPILNGNENMISKKVNASTGSAATAEVVYKIPGSDGKTYTLSVNLTKENDVWKILNFDSTSK